MYRKEKLACNILTIVDFHFNDGIISVGGLSCAWRPSVVGLFTG